ncbi:MAG: phosphocarrier protein HPr [Verrucomicrobia bacterium 21-51-4]|nr:MAG: phosphocarrier protein HPr [Verrucomicrobia bacterium 21-51-4]HQU08354.1 HPr family phosphocarrier protein [Opitutales bacterium]
MTPPNDNTAEMDLTLSRTFVVQNKMGLHARPAAMIVRLASRYAKTDLWIAKDNEQINGKSIMALMMLAAAKGSELKCTAVGPEGQSLLHELEQLFERKFEEA